LDFGQLLDQFVKGVVVEVELALAGAERDAAFFVRVARVLCRTFSMKLIDAGPLCGR